MTLLAKISYASNASRRLPQAVRVFKRYESSKAGKALERYVKYRRFLYGTSFDIDLKNPSLDINRNITTGNALRLAKKPSSKDTKANEVKSKSSTSEGSTSGQWKRLDHDCKKVTKVLLAQAATAPIRQAEGPHKISTCSSTRSGGRCSVPVTPCKAEGSSYSDNPCDVDHVKNQHKEKEEISEPILHTQMQPDKKDLELLPKETPKLNNEKDFIEDIMALSSVYISPSISFRSSNKDGGDSDYIPPFFHLVDKWKEHDQNHDNSKVRMDSSDDTVDKSENHISEFRTESDISNRPPKPSSDDSKGHDRKKPAKSRDMKHNANVKKTGRNNQNHQPNPMDTIPILGTTLTPIMQSDKTPPPPKVDCQIQVPDGSKKDGKDLKQDGKPSKESGDGKGSKGGDACKSPHPTGPKCEDGTKAKGKSDSKSTDCSKSRQDSKAEKRQSDKDQGGAIDCSKLKTEPKSGNKEDSKKLKSEKDKGSPVDCSKYQTEGKGQDSSKSKETLKKESGSQIDCSKYSTDSKGKDQTKDKDAGKKSSDTQIDCSKFKTEPKGKDSKEKDKTTETKIDCSKYKVPAETQTADKSKDVPKKGKDNCLPCDDPKAPKKQSADADKKDKPKTGSEPKKPSKSSAPTIKGCGGVTLESGETSIDCSAISADKKSSKSGGDKKPDASKKMDADKKLDCTKKPDSTKKAEDSKKGTEGDKKAPIDCTKFAAKTEPQKDGQKKESGLKETKKTDAPDSKKLDCSDSKSTAKDTKKESKGTKPDSKGAPPIDCSKYVKANKSKSDKKEPKKSDSKSDSGDAKKGSSTGKGICAEQKGSGDSKSTGKASSRSSKSSGGSSTSITKSKDCQPIICTKTVKKPKKPEPSKIDPAKRIKVKETPKHFNCCLKITAPEKVSIENCPMPELDHNGVVVRMNRLGLCASDVFMYEQGMQKLGGGDISLGHEGAGVVVEVGCKVTHLKRGDGVVIEPGIPCGHCKFCRSGRYNICPFMKFTGLLSTFVSHPAKFCHKVKKSTKLEKAALAHPLALALHSCKMGRISVGSKVLILGACPRGLSTIIAARMMGADKIAVIDTLQKNLKVASELCADISIQADAKLSGSQLAEKALAEMKCRPNVVIDCCGCSKTVKLAVHAVEQGGRCVLAGCQAESAEFPILPALAKEISYKTSFRLANMFPRALNLIETGRANVQKMITHRVEFCEAQNAFHCASKEDESGAIKVMIKWPKEKEENECKK